MSPAPRIVCKAGPSLDDLTPVPVNSESIPIDSPRFRGNVFVRLKGYRGPVGGPPSTGGPSEPGDDIPFSDERDTWSISFEGTFLREVKVDDILFGNTWEKPIKSFLPYGTSAALRFVKYVDPTLSCDLYSDKPWALSPLFSTLQYLSVKRKDEDEVDSQPTRFKPNPMPEDTKILIPNGDDVSQVDSPSKRRSYFAQEAVRQAVTLSPNHVLRGDFSHGFLDFSTLSLSLPGGLSFSLAKYWNGEPVVFNCRSRSTGESFFVVTFELQAEDGSSLGPAQEGGRDEVSNEAQSDDVD